HLDDGIVLVLVHLVDKAAVRARAALLVVGGDRAEERVAEDHVPRGDAADDHHEEPDPRGERRLPRALARLDVGDAKAARALGVVPAEQRADDERFPGREVEGLALELPGVEAEDFGEKVERALGEGEVERPAALVRVESIIEVARAGGADMRAGEEAARDDGLRVAADGVAPAAGDGSWPVTRRG